MLMVLSHVQLEKFDPKPNKTSSSTFEVTGLCSLGLNTTYLATNSRQIGYIYSVTVGPNFVGTTSRNYVYM